VCLFSYFKFNILEFCFISLILHLGLFSFYWKFWLLLTLCLLIFSDSKCSWFFLISYYQFSIKW
jgi:hypothetical protein